MLTDDEKRELIAEVRIHLDRTRVLSGEGYEQKLMGRLADALEGTLTEPVEWEYGYGSTTAAIPNVIGITDVKPVPDPLGRVTVRRRKAGPWEVVPDV